MLDKSCVRAYRKFYPDDVICYNDASELLSIVANGKTYDQPLEETEDSFMKRLERCTPERNLFIEEWTLDTRDYSNLIL